MANYTVQGLLDRSRGFHHKLSGYYRKLDEGAAQERVQMILKYLQRHEQNLETCLSAYEHGASEAVLNTWFKFSSGLDIPDLADLDVVDPDLSVDDVVALAIRYDESLIHLYRQAEATAVSDEVKDLFRKLVMLAEAEEHQLARDTVEMQDL